MPGLEKKLIKKAIALGISGDTVGRAVRFKRIATSPLAFLQQRSEARRISSSSNYSNYVDPDLGYRLFGPNDLPGISNAVTLADQFFQRRKEMARENASKPFFANLCNARDLEQNPQFLDFANSKDVYEIATDYLRSIPKISAFGIFYSPTNDMLEKSQMWHTDDEDLRQLKCFINVHDVGPDNGPFTFINAVKSDEIRKRLNHQWRGPRLPDEILLAHCAPEDIIAVTGASGSGVFVDTCRCLHFGSRARVGHRLVIMFQYTRTPDLSVRDGTEKKHSSIILTDH